MKLLVIEDSPRLQRSLHVGLTGAGHAVDVAGDGREGLLLARTHEYDVIVLDLMLPHVSGHEVLRTLRAEGRDVHVLILSAKDQVDDRVQGLRQGADDYLVKPFSFEELLARIEALVRHSYSSKNPVIEIRGLALDANRRCVTRAGEPVHVTATEYALLEVLARGAGRVFSKPQLMDRIYEAGDAVSSNVIEVLVSGLRKKIQPQGSPPIIQTRRGFGYVIEK